MNWYLEPCPVCGGTLHDDLDDKGWVTCFSCARSFAAQDERLIALLQPASDQVEGDRVEAPLRRAA
jgi:hypothetical protein